MSFLRITACAWPRALPSIKTCVDFFKIIIKIIIIIIIIIIILLLLLFLMGKENTQQNCRF
jgi:flagellar biosynthesis protein FlhB